MLPVAQKINMARRNRQSGSENPRMEQAGASENRLRHWEILMIPKYKIAELSWNDHHVIQRYRISKKTEGVGIHYNNRIGPSQNRSVEAASGYPHAEAGCKMSEQATSRYILGIVVTTAHATPHLANRNGGVARGTRVQLHYAQNNRMYICTTSACP